MRSRANDAAYLYGRRTMLRSARSPRTFVRSRSEPNGRHSNHIAEGSAPLETPSIPCKLLGVAGHRANAHDTGRDGGGELSLQRPWFWIVKCEPESLRADDRMESKPLQNVVQLVTHHRTYAKSHESALRCCGLQPLSLLDRSIAVASTDSIVHRLGEPVPELHSTRSSPRQNCEGALKHSAI